MTRSPQLASGIGLPGGKVPGTSDQPATADMPAEDSGSILTFGRDALGSKPLGAPLPPSRVLRPVVKPE